MEYDIKQLRDIIDNYYIGIVSKTELGEWADKAYYDLLKGGYVERKKIVLYPFLKIISTFHLKENDKDDIYPCSEESIKKIQEILHGKINFDFDIEMSIPAQVYTMFKERVYFDKERRNMFLEVKDAIIRCLKQESIFSNYTVTYLKKIASMEYQNNTVQGLLEEHIFRLIKIFLDSGNDEVENKISFKLYAQKLNQNNLIVERLLNYLDSYIGNKNFHLIISFRDGNPDISLLV